MPFIACLWHNSCEFVNGVDWWMICSCWTSMDSMACALIFKNQRIGSNGTLLPREFTHVGFGQGIKSLVWSKSMRACIQGKALKNNTKLKSVNVSIEPKM